MIPEDLRILAMLDWLENDLLMTIQSFESASSDASFRRYFRVKTSSGQFIVMDAPPDKENTEPFIRIAELMRKAQVNVPRIFDKNLTEGFLLLEDFGPTCFLDQLASGNADALYQSAFESLIRIQANISLPDCGLPAYNEALLKRELGIFDEWFLGHALDISFPDDVRESVHNLLINSALEQPTTCVHRDYHSRNLMVLNNNSPGILDFQDAVLGPITYDLVSLLRDCYIAWPEQQISLWMTQYYQLLLQAALIDCDLTRFKRWFDLMGMQRHLKAIGIFSRLHSRDGKSNYLKDIPRTLNYVKTQALSYPELADFSRFLQDQILPACNIAA
jgi:aminoglycoside/choline kinase family phosphotransferase